MTYIVIAQTVDINCDVNVDACHMFIDVAALHSFAANATRMCQGLRPSNYHTLNDFSCVLAAAGSGAAQVLQV